MAKKRPKPVALSSSDSEQDVKSKNVALKKKAMTKKKGRQLISDSGNVISILSLKVKTPSLRAISTSIGFSF